MHHTSIPAAHMPTPMLRPCPGMCRIHSYMIGGIMAGFPLLGKAVGLF